MKTPTPQAAVPAGSCLSRPPGLNQGLMGGLFLLLPVVTYRPAFQGILSAGNSKPPIALGYTCHSWDRHKTSDSIGLSHLAPLSWALKPAEG